MSREHVKRLTIAVIIGFSLTMLLGFLPNRSIYGEIPEIGIAWEPMLGAGHWGYVLPWLTKVVYPGSATEIVWRNLAMDVVIWTLVSYAFILLIEIHHERMNI